MTLPTLDCAWNNLPDTIYLIEDPVYGSFIDVKLYTEAYGEIVNTLDGKYPDSKVSYFFEVSRVNQSSLVFYDEKKKNEFFEEAIELGLIPGLKEIQEGEDKEDKLKRIQSEKGITKQKALKVIKKVNSDDSGMKQAMITESAKKQLMELTEQYDKLNDATSDIDIKKKEKLSAKIYKVKLILSKNQ